MKRTILLILGVSALLGPIAQTVAKPGQDRQMRQDIEELKRGQGAILKELQEIKLLLQARQRKPTLPSAQPIDAVLEIGDSPVKGSKNAELTLMEFSDYQCSFCKRHAEETLPQIDNAYIATGKLRYVFRNQPIRSRAEKAAEAAHCAGDQGKFWEMHAQLFANQKNLAPEKLYEHAQAVDLKADTFKQCLDSGKYAEKVKRDIAEGEKLGVNGTPTFLLGASDGNKVREVKMMRGALPFSLFRQEIDKLLKDNKSGDQKK